MKPVPSYAVNDINAVSPQFATEKRMRLDAIADEMLAIADDPGVSFAEAEQRIEALKRKYERLEAEHGWTN